jgi:hypothetical protein
LVTKQKGPTGYVDPFCAINKVYFFHDAKMVRFRTGFIVLFKQKIVKIKEFGDGKVTL